MLTLSMWRPSYLSLIRSISWLLMPWLLMSPGHRQQWYWLCEIVLVLVLHEEGSQFPVSYQCGGLIEIVNTCLCFCLKIVNPCDVEFILGGKEIFVFSIIPQHRSLKSSLLEDRDPFMLQSQYHGCWWPGDARSQDINNHGIDLVRSEYSGFTTTKVDWTIANYDKIWIKRQKFSLKKKYMKMQFQNWWPFFMPQNVKWVPPRWYTQHDYMVLCMKHVQGGDQTICHIYTPMVTQGVSFEWSARAVCFVVSISRPEQNGWYLADDILKYIFLNENVHILVAVQLRIRE